MKFMKLYILMVLVALTACGGGGGKDSSGSGNTKNSLSLDVSSVSFKKMNTDSAVVTKEVNVTFKGDGIAVGYPPGVAEPFWLVVDVASSTQNSAKVTITIVGGVMYNPGTYNTTVRIVTGDQLGANVAYKDVLVSMVVDQAFDVIANDKFDFWLVGENTHQIMRTSNYRLEIRGGESDWNISTDVNWLTFSKSLGTGSAVVTISVNPELVPSADSEAQIQVKDKTSSDTKVFAVNFDKRTQDKGVLVNASQPYQFHFQIRDVLIDSANQKLYFTDPNARRVYVVSLTSGLTEKYFNFDFIPHSLAIAPDNKKLYVNLLTQENSPYYWEEDQTARIAVIDIVELAVVNELRLKVAPGDIVVTSKNQLIVGGGSAQHVYFYFYDLATGALIKRSQTNTSPITYMQLLPSEQSLYYSVSWQAPPPVYRFDLDEKSLAGTEVLTPHGDWTSPVDFWINPESTYGVTTEGDVFKTVDTSYVTRMTADYVFIKTAAFDPVNNRLVIVNVSEKSENRGHQQLVEYDPVSWQFRRVIVEPFTDYDRLLYVNNKIQILRKREYGYLLEPLNL